MSAYDPSKPRDISAILAARKKGPKPQEASDTNDTDVENKGRSAPKKTKLPSPASSSTSTSKTLSTKNLNRPVSKPRRLPTPAESSPTKSSSSNSSTNSAPTKSRPFISSRNKPSTNSKIIKIYSPMVYKPVKFFSAPARGTVTAPVPTARPLGDLLLDSPDMTEHGQITFWMTCAKPIVHCDPTDGFPYDIKLTKKDHGDYWHLEILESTSPKIKKSFMFRAMLWGANHKQLITEQRLPVSGREGALESFAKVFRARTYYDWGERLLRAGGPVYKWEYKLRLDGKVGKTPLSGTPGHRLCQRVKDLAPLPKLAQSHPSIRRSVARRDGAQAPGGHGKAKVSAWELQNTDGYQGTGNLHLREPHIMLRTPVAPNPLKRKAPEGPVATGRYPKVFKTTTGARQQMIRESESTSKPLKRKAADALSGTGRDSKMLTKSPTGEARTNMREPEAATKSLKRKAAEEPTGTARDAKILKKSATATTTQVKAREPATATKSLKRKAAEAPVGADRDAKVTKESAAVNQPRKGNNSTKSYKSAEFVVDSDDSDA